jgi:hypothetical protein
MAGTGERRHFTYQFAENRVDLVIGDIFPVDPDSKNFLELVPCNVSVISLVNLLECITYVL